MRLAILLLSLAAAAACSSSEMPPSRGGPRGPFSPATGQGGSPGTGAAGVTGAFDNPNSMGIPVVPPAGNGAPPMSGDPAPCKAGMFCGPTGPDPNNCGTLRLEQDVKVTRHPGNLLLVFDQSGSMLEPWTTGGNKLTAAQMAIQNAITALKDQLTVGALFFPTYACIPALPPPPGGAVTPIEGEGQIPFQPADQFLAAWNQHWMLPGIGLGIGTPMNEAFDRADVAIKNAKLTGNIAVVAVTDGQPNCLPDPALTMTPTMPEPMRAASWLASNNIKTYVVGLPGAQGVQILNDVAMSGGTMSYIIPDDPKMLEAKLKEVISETVKTGFDSCSITLTPAADPVDKLLMVVEENGKRSRVERVFGNDGGWSVSPDGKQVEIQGKLCDDAKAGRFDSITFEYGCKDAEIPPPLTPT